MPKKYFYSGLDVIGAAPPDDWYAPTIPGSMAASVPNQDMPALHEEGHDHDSSWQIETAAVTPSGATEGRGRSG
jgi:hypothetical protein